MKYLQLLILLFSPLLNVVGQEKIEKTTNLSYSIIKSNDTINYIKIGEDSSPKPTLLFLQGSLPSPLIIDFGDIRHTNLPFKPGEISKSFNIVIISMPYTPLIANQNQLNKSFSFITDTSNEQSFHPEFIAANHLDNYIKRAEKVIKDMASKEWFLKDQIHLIGHSQGAKVATVLASRNKKIATVSLLGFNPFGRFDELIRKERTKLSNGEIDGDEYFNNLTELYVTWENITANKENNLDWNSFSIDYTPFLLKIKSPIFVGFGTEDIIAENCDLLPLKFIENKKSNLHLSPYPGLDHNFFSQKDGRPDYANGGHWDKVVKDILNWVASKE